MQNYNVFCRVYSKENPNGIDMDEGEWDAAIVDYTIHRIDGPAEEFVDGHTEWWLENSQLDKKLVETWLQENNIDLKTSHGQMAFLLRWG